MPKPLKIPKLFKKTAEELLWDIRYLSKHASTTEADLVSRYCRVIVLFTDPFILKNDARLDSFQCAKNHFYFENSNRRWSLEDVLYKLTGTSKIFLKSAESNTSFAERAKKYIQECAEIIEHLEETIKLRKYAISALSNLRLFSNNQFKEHDQRLMNSDFGMGSSSAQALLRNTP